MPAPFSSSVNDSIDRPTQICANCVCLQLCKHYSTISIGVVDSLLENYLCTVQLRSSLRTSGITKLLGSWHSHSVKSENERHLLDPWPCPTKPLNFKAGWCIKGGPTWTYEPSEKPPSLLSPLWFFTEPTKNWGWRAYQSQRYVPSLLRLSFFIFSIALDNTIGHWFHRKIWKIRFSYFSLASTPPFSIFRC